MYGSNSLLPEVVRVQGGELPPRPVVHHDVAGAVCGDHLLLINLWGTWCGPCRVETPVLVNLQEEYGDQRFQVIGIAVRDDLEAVRAAIDEYGINYPVLFDDGSLSEAFGRALPAGMIEGYPTNLYAGPGGEIRAVSTGAPSNPAFVERVFRGQVEYQLERVWERLEKR